MFHLKGIDILLITVGVILLAAGGYIVPAMLVGVFGVFYLLTKDVKSSFEEVEVPQVGPYPKFEEWKNLMKDTAEFLGGQAKGWLHTEIPVDKWSDFVKKEIYGAKGSDKEIVPPPWMGAVVGKGFGKDLGEKTLTMMEKETLLKELEKLSALEKNLIRTYEKIDDEDTRRKIIEALSTIREKEKKILDELIKEEEKDN